MILVTNIGDFGLALFPMGGVEISHRHGQLSMANPYLSSRKVIRIVQAEPFSTLMQLQTTVAIAPFGFRIEPATRLLFVGSCFATNLGQRFADNMFSAVVNPRGVMYNPVSVLHTVESEKASYDVVFLTLGTNHVYVDVETEEVVDNCAKRPQSDFREEVLGVEACAEALKRCVDHLRRLNPSVRVVLTVSPIRYAKYGYHGSQLSKAVLLLAAQQVADADAATVSYFPAYEIVLDELRDYRFYAADMLHPSGQAVDYLWERVSESMLSDSARRFVEEWQPIARAMAHQPFDAASETYQDFLRQTKEKIQAFADKYPHVKALLPARLSDGDPAL